MEIKKIKMILDSTTHKEYMQELEVYEFKKKNSQQDERARNRKVDNISNEVIFSASQSKSNKRDMGNPADTSNLCEYGKESELFDMVMMICEKKSCEYQLYTMGINYCKK